MYTIVKFSTKDIGYALIWFMYRYWSKPDIGIYKRGYLVIYIRATKQIMFTLYKNLLFPRPQCHKLDLC